MCMKDNFVFYPHMPMLERLLESFSLCNAKEHPQHSFYREIGKIIPQLSTNIQIISYTVLKQIVKRGMDLKTFFFYLV